MAASALPWACYDPQGPTMDMEDFVAEMAVQMRHSTMGPLSALSARRSTHRSHEAEQVTKGCPGRP